MIDSTCEERRGKTIEYDIKEIKTAVPPSLLPYLQRTPSDPRPVVIMTCGLAGTGKTTLVKSILKHHPHFTRVSSDAILFDAHGIYGIDYAASLSLYNQYQDEVDVVYLETFRRLLAEEKDIILERSFYAKEDRDEFHGIAVDGGARVVLVFLRAKDKELLWERICKRSRAEKTADNALDISRETFEMYWSGFEDPDNEGEIVIEVV
ncbi:P-loop containing nucleoside triphosphate hydrolase protein [Macroventuria anomochaeta]|uniref:P-loop containing nucleoside triphosphate hydrolase protein n=2 Tax=Macroventuria anomochaeta TaxID=301207 RepID=A0ACB6RHB6_9PLEO|nr:P-loop containing nucleoside triphosphate hydrolase protein [Macroventuria anomochaeta]XP_033555953.1 P-loop containing nucleoside triphosphate hydrolase protein [Macroventuria anomochaeta]KAF2621154.1 P-loop containing nucleoside triphosphate hydrolase protein [Macroventuria anomochaeta]KAF2621750.1 P-loop containing nucleoside triphosphate hydrolase protein [Macroventuria anomochaeta]